jgi:hypothetical protein
MTTFIQGSAGSFLVYLEDSATALPATGVLFSGVTASLKKEGGAFAALVLSGTNFTELSGGYYEIDVDVADTDTLGNLYLSVAGATVRTILVSGYVYDNVATTPPSVTAPPVVNVFGYVYGVNAAPIAGASVSCKVLGAPAVLFPGTDGIVLGQTLITTETDSFGFFSLNLIPGTTVDFFIPAARYRRTFLVPSTSSSVFEIP